MVPGPGQTQSGERSFFLERAATLSRFQPTKRTRLCSDVDVSPSGKDGRSPFFAAKPEPSPSIRKRGKTKKARLSDIEIFSDDSVADIFQDMPEEAGPDKVSFAPIKQAEKPKQNTIDDYNETGNPVTEVCDTPIRQRINVPQAATSMATPTISINASDDQEEFQGLVDIHVKQLDNLRNTFAYQSPEKQTAALRGLSPPNSDPQDSKQEFTKAENRSTQDAILGPSQGPVIHRPGQHTSSLNKTFGTQSSLQQAAALRSLGQPQSSAQKVRLGLAALDSVGQPEKQQRPLSPPQQLGQQAFYKSATTSYTGGNTSPTSQPIPGDTTSGAEPPLTTVQIVGVQGSEDLLVPYSEDEASELSEIDGVEPVRQSLDLTRFAFTANA